MFTSPAFAQTATASSGASGTLFMLLQFLLIGLIFWFFLIRPQQKRARDHRDMISAVKKGDGVITAGGIYGKVTKVEAELVEVEIASGVKVKVVKSTLTDIQPHGTPKPAND
jgi:preprotein translocase subunit YajC